MHPYIQTLTTYLKEHPLNYETANAEALFKDLYWYYTENNPSDRSHIRALYKQAAIFFDRLTVKEQDTVLELFGDICTEQEQLAFRGGMRMGIELVLELLEQL